MKSKEQEELDRKSLFEINDPLNAEHLNSPEAISRLEWLSEQILQKDSNYAAELYLATLSAVLSKHHNDEYPVFTQQLLRKLLEFLRLAIQDLGPSKSGLTVNRKALTHAVRWTTVLGVEELGYSTSDACEIAGRLLIKENHFAAPGPQGPKSRSSSPRKTMKDSYDEVRETLFKESKTKMAFGFLHDGVLTAPDVTLQKVRRLNTGLRRIRKPGRKPLPAPPKHWPVHPEDLKTGRK